MLDRRKKDSALVAQVNFHPRLDFQFVGKLGIHAGTRCREGLQNRGSFEGAVDEHAPGGVRGFAARLTAFDDYLKGSTADDPLRPTALEGKGYALEAKKDYDGAMAALGTV